mmetsp:Transcript_15066/g.20510  ORF Transcript_15066/g.20510 Transcript_15066/m.20510 type:complete len:222 (+) Transcript_15066:86-751(+)
MKERALQKQKKSARWSTHHCLESRDKSEDKLKQCFNILFRVTLRLDLPLLFTLLLFRACPSAPATTFRTTLSATFRTPRLGRCQRTLPRLLLLFLRLFFLLHPFRPCGQVRYDLRNTPAQSLFAHTAITAPSRHIRHGIQIKRPIRPHRHHITRSCRSGSRVKQDPAKVIPTTLCIARVALVRLNSMSYVQYLQRHAYLEHGRVFYCVFGTNATAVFYAFR